MFFSVNKQQSIIKRMVNEKGAPTGAPFSSEQ
jgi:hypothetical protein